MNIFLWFLNYSFVLKRKSFPKRKNNNRTFVTADYFLICRLTFFIVYGFHLAEILERDEIIKI